jgi:cysteinyl-tRNA synthetase
MHVRFLLVEGKKMSKSEGNFYTLRDLLEKGYKPSTLRYLLASVPYGKPLNFTFAGLEQAAHSVRRVRDFKARMEMAQPAFGRNDKIQELAAQTRNEMRAGLDDDLNTARALGALFDMIREVNTAADRNELRQDDKAPLLAALQQFDEIFAVLEEDPVSGIPDAEVEGLIAERNAAKKARDFARADAIRKQLDEAGIIVEDTKDGIRWKRK